MTRWTRAALVAAAITAVTGAHAGPALVFPDYTADFSLDMQGAPRDQYGPNAGGHAFVFFAGNPFAGDQKASFVFHPDSGVFSFDSSAGTASLTGFIVPGYVSSTSALDDPNPDRIVNVAAGDVNKKLQVDLQFEFRGVGAAGVGSGGPKDELVASSEGNGPAYKPSGPVDPDTWAFFDLTSAVLTGLDDYAGLNMALTQMPAGSVYPFQLGNGANNKNQFFGMSGWFNWAVTAFPDQSRYLDMQYGADAAGRGDVNIEDPTGVPEPGSVALVALALGALTLYRRRRALPAD